MLGDVSDIIFAVVDVEVSTDFPDILSKWSVQVSFGDDLLPTIER